MIARQLVKVNQVTNGNIFKTSHKSLYKFLLEAAIDKDDSIKIPLDDIVMFTGRPDKKTKEMLNDLKELNLIDFKIYPDMKVSIELKNI